MDDIIPVVLRTLAYLIVLAASNAYALPKVVIFSTGGTISGRHDPARGGYMPAATGEDLVAAVPKLKEIVEVQVEPITAINSADMTVEIAPGEAIFAESDRTRS